MPATGVRVPLGVFGKDRLGYIAKAVSTLPRFIDSKLLVYHVNLFQDIGFDVSVCIVTHSVLVQVVRVCDQVT